MDELPHRYSVVASAKPGGSVWLDGDNLQTLDTELPAQFGGTGDRWSPETLFVGAVATCLALTFRGVARARRLTWTSFRCEAEGVLDRVEEALQFTWINIHVHVSVPSAADIADVRGAISKAERTCLVSNSLKSDVRVEVHAYVEEVHAYAESVEAHAVA
jgi:organic hydroperoxide reductase OsmC/OhrA